MPEPTIEEIDRLRGVVGTKSTCGRALTHYVALRQEVKDLSRAQFLAEERKKEIERLKKQQIDKLAEEGIGELTDLVIEQIKQIRRQAAVVETAKDHQTARQYGDAKAVAIANDRLDNALARLNGGDDESNPRRG